MKHGKGRATAPFSLLRMADARLANVRFDAVLRWEASPSAIVAAAKTLCASDAPPGGLSARRKGPTCAATQSFQLSGCSHEKHRLSLVRPLVAVAAIRHAERV